MKFLALLFCLLIAVLFGQSNAQDSTIAPKELEGPPTVAEGPPYGTYMPPIRSTTADPSKVDCGSNSLGAYRGGCDDSVPVIVMPKGRPIMERVLEWFKCGTPSCLKKK